MANNRMYLKNEVTGDKVYLAKYYPSTGWYVIDPNLVARLSEAFHSRDFGHLTAEQMAENAAHKGFGAPHKSIGGMLGGNEWAVEYEEVCD